jgi:pilus assembly protein CpaB
MKSRLLILAAAIVLGVVAALLVANYLNDASARLSDEAEPVQIMVAVQEVPRGTPAEDLLAEGFVELREVPRRYVADGAVSSDSAIAGQVLATSLGTGEQVTASRFRYARDVGLSYGIPEGHVAVSVSADDVKCVGGMLKPGDFVLIIATFDPGPAGEGAETRILLEKVKVLAVGAMTDAESQPTTTTDTGRGGLAGDTANTTRTAVLTVTLALAPADAEKLVFAEEQGVTRLGLLPATATDVPDTPGRSLDSIFE